VSVPLVELIDVARYFDVSPPWLNRVIEGKPRQILRAVDGVSFTIEKGETLGLVGESGCGKSTVARLIVGLYHPTRGHIRYAGREVDFDNPELALRRTMQMIFQDPYASLNPRLRVDAIVAEPIRAFDLIQGDQNIRSRVGELLGLVGLHADDGWKYPHEFSGGQRQRIGIARALILQPKLVVADEPVSALDVSVGAQVLLLLQDLQREFGLTYVFISHSLPVVAQIATRIAVMRAGKLVELGEAEQLLRHPAQQYTKDLLAAVPEIAVR